MADALSTAFLVMGVGRSETLLRRLDSVDAFFIRKDGSTSATASFPVGATS